jgi:hypothetical protein
MTNERADELQQLMEKQSIELYKRYEKRLKATRYNDKAVDSINVIENQYIKAFEAKNKIFNNEEIIYFLVIVLIVIVLIFYLKSSKKSGHNHCSTKQEQENINPNIIIRIYNYFIKFFTPNEKDIAGKNKSQNNSESDRPDKSDQGCRKGKDAIHAQNDDSINKNEKSKYSGGLPG